MRWAVGSQGAVSRVVMRQSKEAAMCGHWLQAGEGKGIAKEVIGPLLMSIDVKQPEHRKRSQSLTVREHTRHRT